MKDKIMVGEISVFTEPTTSDVRTEKDAAFMITSEGTVFIYPLWTAMTSDKCHINISLVRAYVCPRPHHVVYYVHSLPECVTFTTDL